MRWSLLHLCSIFSLRSSYHFLSSAFSPALSSSRRFFHICPSFPLSCVFFTAVLTLPPRPPPDFIVLSFEIYSLLHLHSTILHTFQIFFVTPIISILNDLILKCKVACHVIPKFVRYTSPSMHEKKAAQIWFFRVAFASQTNIVDNRRQPSAEEARQKISHQVNELVCKWYYFVCCVYSRFTCFGPHDSLHNKLQENAV